MGGARLLRDECACFAVIRAAFGMAEDDRARARIGQHGRGEVAGMRARRGGVAILCADHQRAALGKACRLRQKRRGGADQDIDVRRGMGGGERGDLAQAGPCAVHLPVASGQPAFHSMCLSMPFDALRAVLTCLRT